MILNKNSNLQSEESIKIQNYFNSLPKIQDEIIEGFGRVYYININNEFQKYPSVTTFLGKVSDKSWLEEWKSRIGEEEAIKKTKEASDRGTVLHELTEQYLKGMNIIIPEIQDDAFKKGYELFKKLKGYYLGYIEPIIQEVPLWSNKFKIAGRVDCIGYYKGILSVIDFKSSNNFKSEQQIQGYFLQCTLYAMFLNEMLGIAVKQIVILISVDNGIPQSYIKQTKDYIPECVRLLKQFNKEQ